MLTFDEKHELAILLRRTEGFLNADNFVDFDKTFRRLMKLLAKWRAGQGSPRRCSR